MLQKDGLGEDMAKDAEAEGASEAQIALEPLGPLGC